MRRIVADLGNSRLKWAVLGPGGQLSDARARTLEASGEWLETVDTRPGDSWTIASVNPSEADRLGPWLESRKVSSIRWLRSAADVPLPFGHDLARPDRTGVDRALGVSQALAVAGPETGGVVVSVGSALVVERVAPGGRWQGGAISAGLGPLARALRQSTAQLPEVLPGEDPPAWGASTGPALHAGLFWGLVGAARELVTRQKAGLPADAWTIWTGGDAPRIAPWIDGKKARTVPDLVLQALSRLTFASEPEP